MAHHRDAIRRLPGRRRPRQRLTTALAPPTSIPTGTHTYGRSPWVTKNATSAPSATTVTTATTIAFPASRLKAMPVLRVSITRTPDELSIVCPEEAVPPDDVTSEDGWRALKVPGPIPFETTGVLAGIAAPLAAAGISIFAISTFDTDYVLRIRPKR